VIAAAKAAADIVKLVSAVVGTKTGLPPAISTMSGYDTQ
jgi:hypothetical protein